MEEKKLFEFKIQEFLLNCRITGINVEINDEDKKYDFKVVLNNVKKMIQKKYIRLQT